ncbi:unnamed protein product [Hymenolepis diminuta]|nr:unnamed protein product [Hymenolepis diminuta]
MKGYPFSFSRPWNQEDDVGFGVPERMFFDMLQSFFDDFDDFHMPYRTYGGYLVPHNPRMDYVIDEDEAGQSQSSFPPSFSRSFYSSSSFSSSANGGNQFETIKTSVKQPDGTQILKEIVRRNGQETVTTKTTYPDGRVESTTETRGNALESNTAPPSIMSPLQPPVKQTPQTGGLLSNIRRWFRGE